MVREVIFEGPVFAIVLAKLIEKVKEKREVREGWRILERSIGGIAHYEILPVNVSDKSGEINYLERSNLDITLDAEEEKLVRAVIEANLPNIKTTDITDLEDDLIPVLYVVKPPYKHYMISFYSKNTDQAEEYGEAIEELARELRYNAIHQIGVSDLTRYQGWEFWYPSDEIILRNLIPKIHAKARVIHRRRTLS